MAQWSWLNIKVNTVAWKSRSIFHMLPIGGSFWSSATSPKYGWAVSNFRRVWESWWSRSRECHEKNDQGLGFQPETGCCVKGFLLPVPVKCGTVLKRYWEQAPHLLKLHCASTANEELQSIRSGQVPAQLMARALKSQGNYGNKTKFGICINWITQGKRERKRHIWLCYSTWTSSGKRRPGEAEHILTSPCMLQKRKEQLICELHQLCGCARAALSSLKPSQYLHLYMMQVVQVAQGLHDADMP